MPDYFELEELRTLPQVGNRDVYPDARVAAVAAAIEAIIDREVFGPSGVGFVGRTFTETLSGGGESAILLATPYVRSLTSVTLNGTVLDVDDLTARNGILRRTSPGPLWSTGTANIEVTYIAGHGTDDTVPGDIKEAALQGTRYRLLATAPASELNERQTSSTNEMGGTISYATAGSDRPTGYPTVDATIVARRQQLNTVTFP